MFRQICARSLSTTYRAAVVASRPSFKRYAIPQLSVNLREIHATSSKNKEKQEEPLPPTLIEQYKLDQPSRWVPLLLGSFGLASATGLYHFDSETQMLGLFALFVGTIYSQGGEAIGKFFDETSDAILKEQLAVEEAQIKAVKTALEAHQKQAGIYGNIKEIIEAQKEIIDEIGEAAQMRLKHEVRDNFVRKLDTVVDMQNKVNSSVREALINNATMAVRESFISGDPKLKEDALTNALAAIQNPEAQKGKFL